MTLTWPFANEKVANMYQQHVRQSSRVRMRIIRLQVPLQQHELRLRRPRLRNGRVQGSECRPI